jgi:hypothetical protein
MHVLKKKNKTAKPFLLVLFNFLLLFILPVNYFLICLRGEISYYNFREIFLAASIFDWILIIPPIVIVPGIRFLKKWAWIMLMVYATLSIFINSYASIMVPSNYNLGALTQALFSMLVIAYFIQKDIRSAFFKAGFKGWRISERYSMNMEAEINGHKCKCLDMSPSGCAVAWPNCPLQKNMPVLISFKIRKKQFHIKGNIARIMPSGEVGIFYVNTEVETEKVLRELLAGIS